MKNCGIASRLLPTLLLLVFATPFNILYAQEKAATAPDATRLQLAGLHAPVTVRRDERGIPYIEAANEADLYFAQGYVTANDRLWQMDLLRRTARGELSEIFGKATLEEDKRRRIYGFASLSETLAAQSSAPVRAALEAYARGVNAFIATLDDKSLPAEFRILQYKPRQWRPADSMVLGKILAESLSTTWDVDVARAAFSNIPEARFKELVPETSTLDVVVVGSDSVNKKAASLPSPKISSDHFVSHTETFQTLALARDVARRSLERLGLFAEDLAASNNWVVNGKHTASGKPLLANDPHLAASAPSIWYLTELSAPNLHVAGVTMPGTPGILLGHNAAIAWGATNLAPDVQDVYLEKFDKENPRRYMTPAGWRDAEVRHEEIKVRKGFADATTETVPFDVTVTRHGPIILEKNGARYALRWTMLDPRSREFESFFAINRARNWNDFRAALKDYPGPTQNFIYADTLGHIGYYGAGRIPLRKTGDGSLPYDGATDAGEWTGFIPFDDLPHVYDPPSGIIVTANNRIVGRNYPYHLTHYWAVPYRARRIYDLLTAKSRLTIEDFRRIHADNYSFAEAILANEVTKLARPLAATSNDWRTMLTTFEKWDGHANEDSRAMALVAQMRAAFRRRILTNAIGAEAAGRLTLSNVNTFLDRIIQTRPREWLPKEFDSYEALLQACYTDARAALTKQLGADESKWTWGRTGQFRFVHPLASVPFIGSQFVVPPLARFTGGSGGAVNVGANVSMRLIADAGDWDNTQQGIALGESGDPASPHWSDQLTDWRNATPRVFPFSRSAITKASKATIVLAPSK
ncbi:MAG: penicillin acylase family protein [Pyrinomonadaceae bacterium]